VRYLRPPPEEAALLGGRLEGWQRERLGKRPSFETRARSALLTMRSELFHRP
jgi:hypothetical protein